MSESRELNSPTGPTGAPAAIDGLSAREREVLVMVSRGLTNVEIADRLTVTVHAVKFHLASIYRKLGVANRTEAAFMYLRSSLGPRRQA